MYIRYYEICNIMRYDKDNQVSSPQALNLEAVELTHLRMHR